LTTIAKAVTLGVAGNPNCGKTTIFNALTGARQHVGNWPGVTVERKEGRFKTDGLEFLAIDLPGTYSLAAYSVEEKIARNYLIEDEPGIVINVIDASNLERNLFLTTQLIELGQPMVIALNMMDMADEKGMEIDTETLGTLLGAPVVPLVGRTGEGIDLLKQKIARVIQDESEKARRIQIQYPRDIEAEIITLSQLINRDLDDAGRARWFAIKLLEQDADAEGFINDLQGSAPILEQAEDSIQRIERLFSDTSKAVIAHARYGFIQGAFRECVNTGDRVDTDYSRNIDKIVTNRWLGIPIFAAMMWLMFKLTYDLGSFPMDWIDSGVAGLMNLLSGIMPESMFASLVVDGAIGGVGAIAVFLPNIFILFFVIAFLEDSGYMARVAFIMDRVMHNIGLHGKAFIPMVMGFGCNVPAIMGTRILESRRDRLVTVLLNPFMSCSARLPVYVLVAGAFFPQNAPTVIFSMYVLGVLTAIASGKLFSKTILSGLSKPFVLELPPYQRPTIRSLLIHTWERGSLFIRKMGTVILVGSIIVWALGYFPRQVELDHDYDSERSKLADESRMAITTIQDRFEESVDLARAAYVSTMLPFEESKAYTSLVQQRDSLQWGIEQSIVKEIGLLDHQQAAETSSKKLIGQVGRVFEPLVAPLGFSWRESVALITGFVAKEIVVSTYGVLFGVGNEADESNQGLISSLRSSGMTPLVALGFLVFTLLYTPCLATVAAIRRETGGWGYTLFSIAYSFSLAWLLAFGIYRVGGWLNWLS